jgi:hypothetical protein
VAAISKSRRLRCATDSSGVPPLSEEAIDCQRSKAAQNNGARQAQASKAARSEARMRVELNVPDSVTEARIGSVSVSGTSGTGSGEQH